jgi:hypothetical protein
MLDRLTRSWGAVLSRVHYICLGGRDRWSKHSEMIMAVILGPGMLGIWYVLYLCMKLQRNRALLLHLFAIKIFVVSITLIVPASTIFVFTVRA